MEIDGRKTSKTLIEIRNYFIDHMVETPRCWLWTGSLYVSGYGRAYVADGSQPVRAHRLSWILFRGEIPKDKSVLHDCDVRNCVNPDDLYLGTDHDNMVDQVLRGRHPRTAMKFCKRGHSLTDPDNVYLHTGKRNLLPSRHCIECASEVRNSVFRPGTQTRRRPNGTQ